jgi:UDP-N-acetylmuramoyl-tripeptide--D-alanyl-D-alanine ligase
MRAALSAFDTNYKKHKVVILGAMMELGSYSDAAHQQIVDLLATMNIETVCLIGKPFKKTQNHPANTFLFEDTATFANWISNHPLIQKNILLKGSRAMALEKLQPSL